MLPLQAEIDISVEEDEAWTRQQLSDILEKLPSTPKKALPSLLQPLTELEGEDVLRVAVDLFKNDHSPADQPLQLAIVNAQHRRLALQLLEDRALMQDFNLDIGIVDTLTAMAMRIADPDAFAAETAPWPKTPVQSKSLEANAMLYLHDAVFRLAHRAISISTVGSRSHKYCKNSLSRAAITLPARSHRRKFQLWPPS